MQGKVDRRVQKTRAILQNAIVELVVEKGFEAITVQDILDRANVGRSTFYAHYQDKGELLHSCFEELHRIFEQHLKEVNEGGVNYAEFEFSGDFTLKLLKFAERNRLLLNALLKQPDFSEYINNSFFEFLNNSVKKWMFRTKRSSIPSEIVTHYFLNAFTGVLKWWVSTDLNFSAEDLDKYFKQLALPTIKGI